MIETTALTRRFGALCAVDELTMSVARGEVFGFLGPNGAGKTTTMRMLAALIAPTSGEARVAGHRVGSDDDAIRARTGILTETPGHYVQLSARQNLRFYAAMYGVDDAEQQIERYLRLLHLWERRDDLAGTFSKGMQQKLAIARALLPEPDLVILDEPTSALDPESARVVRDAIAELRDQKRTVFLCTHNLAEAEQLCDRIAIFNGKLIRVDTLEGLRRSLYADGVRVRLAKAPDEGLLASIEQLAFVGRAVVDDGDPCALLVDMAAPSRHNPELVRALVAAEAEVLYVEPNQATLERVYLDLINGEGSS